MTIKKPMLAVAGDDLESLEYPRLASPKLDGIRSLTHPTLGLVSRTFKPIRNAQIRAALSYTRVADCMDGELITYNEDGSMRTFNEVQGDVMRAGGQPLFKFHVFDDFTNPDLEFEQRYYHLESRCGIVPFVELVQHDIVRTPDELVTLRDHYMELGYEGLMTRTLAGKYKQGRSTVKQGWLLKHKCWHDFEAVVIGIEELMRNENEAACTECGGTKRSTHRDGLVPAGTTGALILECREYGTFRVGTGFDQRLRDFIWTHKGTVMGSHAKVKCQLEGAKDKPRFPVFLGFRHEDDM